MKLAALRSLLSLSALALLGACGGGDVAPGPGTTAYAGGPATAPVKVEVAVPATGAQPLPDCQPEGCAGLRIIDGNAEAYRIDAMRRDPA
jgi:hypothetical protein